MNILVLEDEGQKGQEIMQILQENKYSFEHKFCINDIKSEIKHKKYDVLILDLKVPKINGGQKEISYGIELVQYIFRNVTEKFFRPKAVLIITSYFNEEEVNKLKEFPISIIQYKVTGEWKKKVLQQLKYFIPFKCDLAIVTAVDNEFEAIYLWEWELKEDIKDMVYYTKKIKNNNGEEINIILVKQEHMGMVVSTMLTSKIINYFKPKCVIMLGICAGRKGEVNLGDMIFAISAWDYGSGSVEENKKNKGINFIPAPNYISVNENLKNIFEVYKAKKNLLQSFKERVFNIAKNINDKELRNLAYKQIDEKNVIHLGAMATGAAVIKNEKFTEMFIKMQNKKYIGLDMETYGVYYAARNSFVRPDFFCVKCVSDVADSNKDDDFQKYSALLASEAVKYYIMNDFIID